MHAARMDETPAIPEPICIVPFNIKPTVRVVLKNSHRVIASFDQEIDGFRTEQTGIKPVEQNGTASSLCMSDLSSKDRFIRGPAPPVTLEITIAEQRNETRPQCFCSSAQRNVACRV